jgi:hypothetical protein
VLEPDVPDPADELELFDEPDLVDADEPVAFAAGRLATGDTVADRSTPVLVAVAARSTLALATAVAARAAAGVAARGAGLPGTVAPPETSRPGTVPVLSVNPATWPLPPAGTGTSGPTAVCDSPTTTTPM